MRYRLDRDTLGEIQVPADAYWGPQTQRSLQNFAIGDDRFDANFIHALATVKVASARTNRALNNLPDELTQLIERAGAEVLDDQLADQFPLSVWQTGSGTQTNMNMNEVLANRANELAGQALGGNQPVHPNDHVNRSQSSNDVFPTAMHIGAVTALRRQLFPALSELHGELERKCHAFADVVKIGRTHMMDATPLTLGQEFSGYAAQVEYLLGQLKHAEQNLLPLAIGGTAVGTGLNSPQGWSQRVCEEIAQFTSVPFTSAQNKFMGLASHDALLGLSNALKQTASVFLTMGNNLRMLAGGPRCGLAEIQLPANEPGSSIMPGKVNPTQIEALTMVATEVIGNDACVTAAASQGHLQLNVFKPVIIHNILRSIRLLSDVCQSFCNNCLVGMEPNHSRIEEHLRNSLMLVTALAPELGYDEAARVAKTALAENKTLREVVLQEALMDANSFDAVMDPRKMLGNPE